MRDQSKEMLLHSVCSGLREMPWGGGDALMCFQKSWVQFTATFLNNLRPGWCFFLVHKDKVSKEFLCAVLTANRVGVCLGALFNLQSCPQQHGIKYRKPRKFWSNILWETWWKLIFGFFLIENVNKNGCQIVLSWGTILPNLLTVTKSWQELQRNHYYNTLPALAVLRVISYRSHRWFNNFVIRKKLHLATYFLQTVSDNWIRHADFR